VPELSVIVPTFREVENLPELLERIHGAVLLAGISCEILVVDDNSRDGTIEACDALRRRHPVRLITRTTERGLSSAVVRGMREANGEILLVMDADLSHPPEKIPEMVAQLRKPGIDFVLGSRYVPGASTDEEWSLFRRMNSLVATGLAWPLTAVRDPMAGFFAIHRKTFVEHEALLDPVGYKIALEILVKCRCQGVKEVPIYFADRTKGESKLTFKVQVQYLRHLRRLYDFRFPTLANFLLFTLVGASGLVIDLICYSAAMGVMSKGPARAIAIWIAMTWNFAFNRNITFAYTRDEDILSQYGRFCLSCMLGAFVNWLVSMSLVTTLPWFADHALIAALPGVAAGLLFNFTICRWAVFSGGEPTPVRVVRPEESVPSLLPSAATSSATTKSLAKSPGSQRDSIRAEETSTEPADGNNRFAA
jgi:dolichol-phosphate mannosyltransferase